MFKIGGEMLNLIICFLICLSVIFILIYVCSLLRRKNIYTNKLRKINLEELSKENSKYMMATKAIHVLGDISRGGPDLCIIFDEDEKNYIGNWVTGYGFIEVKFPKETTRELTEKEREFYQTKNINMAGQISPMLKE